MDLQDKVALVVDDSAVARSTLRGQLADLGLTRIAMVGTAADAYYKIRNTPFDIIVCDYYLGDARDGQQLLEELRVKRMLALETIFIMVTSENRYDKVVAAAEYAPDDYLLKPFASAVLKERILEAFAKKQALHDVYSAIDRERYDRALSLIGQHLRDDRGRYQRELVRLRAETCLRMGAYAWARDHYEEILKGRTAPWAQLGLGKALFHLGEFERAETLFRAVIEVAPQYLESYDWLARAHEQVGRDQDAQSVLQQAIRQSPYRFDRHGRLGRIAYRNEDLDTAESALLTLVEKGRHSHFHSPEDHAQLAQIYLDRDDPAGALKTMETARKDFVNSAAARFCAGVMEARAHARLGDEEAARRAFAEALQVHDAHEADDLETSEEMKLHFACECLKHGEETLGAELLKRAVKNTRRRELVERQAAKLLADTSHAGRMETLSRECDEEISDLASNGMALARSGRWDEAIRILGEAAAQLPNNPQVLLNAAQVILMYVEKTGWDPIRYVHAMDYLHQATLIDPAHTRIPVIKLLASRLRGRFGIEDEDEPGSAARQ